jgi:PAS domain S-box-containing protein
VSGEGYGRQAPPERRLRHNRWKLMPNADPARIVDPERLAALEAADLLGMEADPPFDRYTRLAARLLGAPMSLVSLIAAEHQVRKSDYTAGEGHRPPSIDPLSHSFCQYVVATGEPLVVEDSFRDPRVADIGGRVGIRAYIGIPLRLPSGHSIGALCAYGPEPREWGPEEIAALRDLVAGVETEIELRAELSRRRRSESDVQRLLEIDRDLVETAARFLGASGRDIERDLPLVLGEIGGVLGARNVVIRLIPAAGNEEIEAVWSGDPAARPALPSFLRSEEGHWLLARLREFIAIAVPDRRELGGDGHALDTCLRDAGSGAAAAIPIRSGDRLGGILTVESTEPYHWPEHLVLLLRVIGEAFAVEASKAAAEAALQSVQLRNARILEASLDAIVSTDEEGRLIDFNAAAESIFGYRASDVIGRPMAGLIVPPALREAHYAGVRRLEESGVGRILEQRIEIVALRADGSEFPVELAVTAIPIRGGRSHYAAHIRDISSRKRYEAELLEARAVADASVRAKDDFLARMSHELRTPLNAVIGISHLLGGTTLDERQGEYVEGIRHSANLLLSLIDDLIDLTRIGSGKLEFVSVPMNVAPLLREVVGSLRYGAERKDLRLGLVIEDAVPQSVAGDPVRLKQILVNLVGNAIKFTERGEVRLQVGQLREMDDQVVLRFTVSDTGIGIAPERLEAVFEAFTQESRETTARFGGTGLGLAIVRQLVEGQGGSVVASSKPGVGTVFTVELSFARSSTLPEPEDAGPDAADLRGVRVLVVEDNELNRMVTRQTLVDAGAHVETANDGREAISLLRALPFDLVLMDLQMPHMDGFEATRRIREELGLSASRLPILALTASALAGDRRRVYAVGMNDLILKPCDPSRLREIVARYVERVVARPSDGGDQIREIDRGRLERSTLGDADFARQLVEIFTRMTPDALAELEEANSRGDRDACAAIVHKLKASAGVIGAVTLQRGAAALEEIYRSGADEVKPERLRSLRASYEVAARALERLVSPREPEP